MHRLHLCTLLSVALCALQVLPLPSEVAMLGGLMMQIERERHVAAHDAQIARTALLYDHFRKSLNGDSFTLQTIPPAVSPTPQHMLITARETDLTYPRIGKCMCTI